MTRLSPFNLPGTFLKGNIHTHSNRSDGMLTPDEVAARYRAAGYDFLSITDHFLKSFNFPITDITHLRTEAFTPIFGAEIHAPRTEMSDLWHLVAVGLPPDFAPTAESETGPALARRANAAGAFVGIAHPAWYQLSMDDAETLIDAAHAVEIYNHGCQVMHDKGDGAYMLDGLADKGHRLLTYACDDAHFRTPDFGGGWVMLKAVDRSADAIVAALKAGDYYSTQGPTIQNVELRDDRLLVECSPASGILIAGKGYQNSYHFEAGVSRAELPMDGLDGSPWFRVIIFGQDGKRAWTNPCWR
ncbi:PHP domain-containing protein [Paracoccus onubensis]|uniref:PHP domain-containing protein n=1 Tax=Paracoccus onubensis TaxID=1675788 RepID=UPI00273178F1|nr:PHP domain-containing protein [Paracoccus onubensis]MDP0926227.1 PHP domain-containing protein [Paracoccus onubensis]